jgi:hypothetical protein
MCCFFSYLGRPFFFSRTCVPALRLRASRPGAKTTQKTHTPPAIEWTRREEYSIALPPPHHWYLGFRQSTFGDFLHCRGYPIDFLQPQTMALFIWLIIRLIQLVFSARTIFFSHKKSANSVF